MNDKQILINLILNIYSNFSFKIYLFYIKFINSNLNSTFDLIKKFSLSFNALNLHFIIINFHQ